MLIRTKKDIENILPCHVAIIMDGNGRWAQKRLLPRSVGHAQGVDAVRRAIRSALSLGIPYLTIFSFSSENWGRPREEIDYLFSLLRQYIKSDVDELDQQGVKILVMGERETLDTGLQQLIVEAEERTQNNDKMTLCVAFNYGGRQEILSALSKIIQSSCNIPDSSSQIEFDVLRRHLYAPSVPDPDLLIRTSGEQRLSNFLLWQVAYTELVFIDEHWPDFDHDIFIRTLQIFSERKRRFGGL